MEERRERIEKLDVYSNVSSDSSVTFTTDSNRDGWTRLKTVNGCEASFVILPFGLTQNKCEHVQQGSNCILNSAVFCCLAKGHIWGYAVCRYDFNCYVVMFPQELCACDCLNHSESVLFTVYVIACRAQKNVISICHRENHTSGNTTNTFAIHRAPSLRNT